jgi:transposase
MSRGGFGSKFHLLVDRRGTPLGFTLTSGQVHESTQFEAVMASAGLAGRPDRRRPGRVAGDRGYSNVRIRTWLHRRRMRAVIPYRCNETDRSLDLPGPFARATYRRRNAVERCVGWLKAARRIATRYEKLATTFLAMLKLVILARYLRIAFRNRA